jgi:acetylglutamate/LysW-gamma-L-alpha-aminoadipate kinase
MLSVIKLGGGAGIDTVSAAQDIAKLVRHGEQVVLLHGCSHAADELAEQLREPARYVTSAAGVRSRYTDA